MITPLSHANGCLTQKYINSDFDHVVNVSENMQSIKNVELNEHQINNVSDNMDAVKNVHHHMNDVLHVSGNMDDINKVVADEVDIGKVANNITEVVQVANGMKEYQVTEEFTLEQGQTTVQLNNILAQTAKVEVVGQMVDGTVLLRDTDFTVTAVKRIELKRSYPKGTVIKATQVVYKNQDDPYIVIDELSAFNRKTLPIGIGVDISPYEDAGRTVTPRLLVKSTSYVNIEPIPANTTITSVSVTKEPKGVIVVQTSNGNIRFSSVLAEAFTREEIGKTATITYPYTAIGGELTINVPYVFDNVQAVYINGLRQVRDYSWEWNKADGQVITIAEELINGDLVEIVIGGEYMQLLPPDVDLEDVYGVPVFNLTTGLVITPVNNQYPKLSAFGAIYELADNSVSYTVKSFATSADKYLITIVLEDNSEVFAIKVDAASRKFVNSTTQRSYSSVASFKKDLTLEVGEHLIWSSYYDDWAARLENPTGGNKGVVVTHTGRVADGGSIFDLDNGNQVVAVFNNDVSFRKFGARGDKVTDDYQAMQNAIDSIDNCGKVFVETGEYLSSQKLRLGKGAQAKNSSVRLCGEDASWHNGKNNGAAILKGFAGGSLIECFGLYQGMISTLVLDLNGRGGTLLSIISVNPHRSVDGVCEDLFLWDSAYTYLGVGMQVGDASVNQVSEWRFKRVRFHESLKIGAIQAGDNTVDIVWSQCLFRTKAECYHIRGGGSVQFDSATEMSTTTSAALVKVIQEKGTNNPNIDTVASRVSFIGLYTEPYAAKFLVDFSGVTDISKLPTDTGTAGEYPSRTAVELFDCQVWNSTPKALVKASDNARIDLTIIGGRYHNLSGWMAGSRPSVQRQHVTTLIQPTVTGSNRDALLSAGYGQPYGLVDGVGRLRKLELGNASDSYHMSEIIQIDNGGFIYKKANGNALAEISDDSFGCFGHTWNSQHFKMGSYRLWFDGDGNLRKKVGKPTSDKDGTVIG